MDEMGFAVNIEETFGTYRSPGMRDLVDRWASGRKLRRLSAVYVELIRVHDEWRPPTLAKIMRVEREET